MPAWTHPISGCRPCIHFRPLRRPTGRVQTCALRLSFDRNLIPDDAQVLRHATPQRSFRKNLRKELAYITARNTGAGLANQMISSMK
jgi:hypothetical protein